MSITLGKWFFAGRLREYYPTKAPWGPKGPFTATYESRLSPWFMYIDLRYRRHYWRFHWGHWKFQMYCSTKRWYVEYERAPNHWGNNWREGYFGYLWIQRCH